MNKGIQKPSFLDKFDCYKKNSKKGLLDEQSNYHINAEWTRNTFTIIRYSRLLSSLPDDSGRKAYFKIRRKNFKESKFSFFKPLNKAPWTIKSDFKQGI